MKLIVRTYKELCDAFRQIHELGTDKPLSIECKEYKKGRSLDSNALSHVWYGEIAKARGESVEAIKCFCKLHFGVGIMRAESETFRMMYDKGIMNALTYEEKLKAMTIIPVTSLMNSEQMHWYLRDMQQTFAQEESIILISPADSEYEEWTKQV